MLKRLQELEVFLERERGAVALLDEERRKAERLHEQRDTAEEGRLRTQEQLAKNIEKLQSSEERCVRACICAAHPRTDCTLSSLLSSDPHLLTAPSPLLAHRFRRRNAEAAISETRKQLVDGSALEARIRELERERDKLSKDLHAASSDAKATREREEVLLNRVAMRERLVNVDWSRGSEVVHELRAESARALQAVTGDRQAAAANSIADGQLARITPLLPPSAPPTSSVPPTPAAKVAPPTPVAPHTASWDRGSETARSILAKIAERHSLDASIEADRRTLALPVHGHAPASPTSPK